MVSENHKLNIGEEGDSHLRLPKIRFPKIRFPFKKHN